MSVSSGGLQSEGAGLTCEFWTPGELKAAAGCDRSDFQHITVLIAEDKFQFCGFPSRSLVQADLSVVVVLLRFWWQQHQPAARLTSDSRLAVDQQCFGAVLQNTGHIG